MPIQILNDRSVIAITGPDASTLLQGLVTANIEKIDKNSVASCALLTPQGKIAFDFLIGRREDDGYFFDMRTALLEDFLKRMTLYKLRADVKITAIDEWQPSAIWDETLDPLNAFTDDRFKGETKVYRIYQNIDSGIAKDNFSNIRIANFVAESDADFEANEIFPHDVYFDLNGAIDFKKGCYVGQEVVSRMQHRSSARKRVGLVQAQQTSLISGQNVTANGKPIGKLGTVSDNKALSILRVDRYFDALTENQTVTVNDVEVKVTFPEWAASTIEPYKSAT